MKMALTIGQLVVAILLIVCILLQQKGGGLGLAFGDSMGQYRSRRGAEKLIYRSTIGLAILFVVIALANLLIV